jgi:FPC/CPF motif-containing protein YcgG
MMQNTLTKNELVTPTTTDELAGWEAEVYNEFLVRMTDKNAEFPCVFGVEAVTRGTLRYGFIHDGDEGQAQQLAKLLKDFTEICSDLGKRTSFVCFFESWSADPSHEAYWKRFWDLLRELTIGDEAEWPEDISREMDDPKFEFTFNGQPMFVVINTELHQRRMSRHMSRVAITFQPRFVFDDIAEGTALGDAARQVIRGRLATYDKVPLPESLGSFGDPTNREWTQYYLDDGAAEEIPQTCPFKHL